MKKSYAIFIIICCIIAIMLSGIAKAREDLAYHASSRPAINLTLDERIACEKAIGAIYWKHNEWPKDNAQPKPSYDKIVPESKLKEKVENIIKESNALAQYWENSVTGAHLQAEMERIAKNTKQPEVLHEIWQALDNDPYKIAECLIRPIYVEGFIHQLYSFDSRFHGDLKATAQNELHDYNTLAQMKLMSGTYSEIEWTKEKGDREGEKLGDRKMGEQWEREKLRLSEGQWEQLIAKLSHDFNNNLPGIASSKKPVTLQPSPLQSSFLDRLPTGKISPLQEDENSFYVVALIDKGPNTIKLAAIVWEKQSFDSWWSGIKDSIDLEIQPIDYEYHLPEIITGGCVPDTWTRMYSNPYARSLHTAVWTGHEMIVWGGQGPASNNGYLNTGLRYNPAADTWAFISTINAPTGRAGAQAVWTGSEMIVWGGYICPNSACYPQDYLSTGGRYNPATNTWTPMNANGAPPSLELQTAVWTGSVMVAGGTNGYQSSWAGGRYSPATDTWQPMITNNSLHYCEDAKSVWTGKEVIVWGAPWCTSRYNPVLDHWTAVSYPTIWLGEQGASVIWSGTEMIVWGGLVEMGPGFSLEPTNAGGRYNPKNDTWQPTNLENVPSERSHHSAVWTGSKMLIWGGGNYPGGKYNPVNDSWMMMSTANAPSYYYGYSIVWTGTEMIIWGGGTATNTGSRYKSSSNSWTPISTAGLGNPMPDSRSYNTTVWTGTDIISWGGQSGSQPWGVYTNTGVRYNLAADSWFPTTTINAPTSRAHHAAVWTGTEMIIWGGEYPYMSSGGRYNPATNSWTATSTNNAPIDRYGHSAVWTGNEMIIWGGYSCNNPGCPYTNTGGRYNPTADSWVATSINNAPYGREEHTAVWTGSEMIIWGGGYPETNSGGRYNPATD